LARIDGLGGASAAFHRALELDPNNADAIANLGYIASEQGNSEEAEKLLRRAITLNAKLYPPHYDLGRLLVRLKRYEEGVQVLQGSAVMNANDPGVHYQLFIAFSRLKRKEDAQRELTTFQKLESVRKTRQRSEDAKESQSSDDPALPDPSMTLPADTLDPKLRKP